MSTTAPPTTTTTTTPAIIDLTPTTTPSVALLAPHGGSSSGGPTVAVGAGAGTVSAGYPPSAPHAVLSGRQSSSRTVDPGTKPRQTIATTSGILDLSARFGNQALTGATRLSVPFLFGVAALIFFLLQALLGRRDPKLTHAPVRRDNPEVAFE